MVKIKQKKTMNLPQLIEYIVKNDLRNKMFTSDSKSVEPGVIYVSATGAISTQLSVYGNELFTIEAEEEITEDTEISMLAHYSVFGFKTTKRNASINEEKGGNSIAFYIMNDDKTMTLIWKNGKLVE